MRAYRAGRAARIGGASSIASMLTIRLTRRTPTVPHWMATGFLCATPPETPIRSGGVEGIPSAGSYYIAARTPGHALLLRRNPHYGGNRRSHFDAIDYRFGVSPERAVELVEAGRADHADDVPGQVQTAGAASPAVDARLERRYGGQRYLPPTMPGFRQAAIYPLDEPDPARAPSPPVAGRPRRCSSATPARARPLLGHRRLPGLPPAQRHRPHRLLPEVNAQRAGGTVMQRFAAA